MSAAPACRGSEAGRRLSSAAAELGRIKDQLRQMRATLGEPPKADLALYARLDAVSQAVAELERRLQGDPARQKLAEPETPAIGEYLGAIRGRPLADAADADGDPKAQPGDRHSRLDALERDLQALIAGDLAKLEEAFAAAGAPWTPGRRVP